MFQKQEGLDVQKIRGGVWDSHPGLMSRDKEFGFYAEGTGKPKRGLEELREGLRVQGVGRPRRIAGGDHGEEAGWAHGSGQCVNICALTRSR